MNINLNYISVNPSMRVMFLLLRAGTLNEELIMTSFIQPSYATQHRGVERLESAFATLRALRGPMARSQSFMLWAALVAALMVVADQLIETWVDGHLLAAWVALWLLGFVGLAVFALPAQQLARSASAMVKNWSERQVQARADAQLWALAKADPRVMAELDAARAHSEC